MSYSCNKQNVSVPLAVLEWLEPPVLYSADAAPLSALLDTQPAPYKCDLDQRMLADWVAAIDNSHKNHTQANSQEPIDAQSDLSAAAPDISATPTATQITEVVLIVAGGDKIDSLVKQLRSELLKTTALEVIALNPNDSVLDSFAHAYQAIKILMPYI